ncbi:hypothetical protein B484DRAFT_460341 [Ochromonadaceae sp. CCMP2298]|nr:hypothetical protein B484DRAFT_460341 [Ochromonadaceae sp. CCMP2298]
MPPFSPAQLGPYPNSSTFAAQNAAAESQTTPDASQGPAELPEQQQVASSPGMWLHERLSALEGQIAAADELVEQADSMPFPLTVTLIQLYGQAIELLETADAQATEVGGSNQTSQEGAIGTGPADGTARDRRANARQADQVQARLKTDIAALHRKIRGRLVEWRTALTELKLALQQGLK